MLYNEMVSVYCGIMVNIKTHSGGRVQVFCMVIIQQPLKFNWIKTLEQLCVSSLSFALHISCHL